jgi:nicotinamide mononucleotide adenylyltransferase
MKNDDHMWDNKLPTAQMLGRWQPWHAGHQKLFEEILKNFKQPLLNYV